MRNNTNFANLFGAFVVQTAIGRARIYPTLQSAIAFAYEEYKAGFANVSISSNYGQVSLRASEIISAFEAIG